MKKVEKISKNIKDTEKIAKEFLKNISTRQDLVGFKHATVVALSGEFGAGKTTFTQFIAKELGIKSRVQSPTFVIIKRYPVTISGRPTSGKMVFENLFHIDAYRIKNQKELKTINFAEIISNPKNLVFIEWPENVGKMMPKKYHKIKISHLKEEHRKFELS